MNYIQYLTADGVGYYKGYAAAEITYSKALDDASAIRGIADDFALENALCRACDYGLSDFNIPNRTVISVRYALPFGKGKPLVNRGGVVNEIVGGWNLSGILTVQSGEAVDSGSWDSARVASSNPNSNRLNCMCVNPYVANPNSNNYFNRADFANTTAIPGR